MPERLVPRLLFFERRHQIPRCDDRLVGEENRKRRRPTEYMLGKKGAKKQREIPEGKEGG